MTNKPMMVGETASAESGGKKAVWIKRDLRVQVPKRFPRIRAVIWFHRKKKMGWRVNSSAASLEAFSKVAASSLYQDRLP